METEYKSLMQLASQQGFTDKVRFDNNATYADQAEVTYITKRNWEEIGSPDVITLTITPADISNHPDDN